MKITGAGTNPSAKGLDAWFTGTVRIDPLFQAGPPGREAGATVTFEPGARTAWHTHPAAQTLIVTAGIMPSSPLSALKSDDWHAMVDINIKGVLNGIAAVLPEFIAQKSGHVIAPSSVAGLKAYPAAAVYGGTKFFVRDFMEILRMESAMEGTKIRTTTIYPAAIKTELLHAISEPGTAAGMAALYEQVCITPDRIASVVAFAIEQPADTNVSELTLGPRAQAW
jgi:NADP-dependent 3-hydroxy acid dehydrogenase YdfG